MWYKTRVVNGPVMKKESTPPLNARHAQWTACLKRALWLTAAGCVLLALLLLVERALLPERIEVAGGVLYRVLFFAILPWRSLAAFAVPRVDHHWRLLHYALTAFGAPYFLYACYILGRRLYRLLTRQHSLEALDTEARDDNLPVEALPTPFMGRREFLVRSAAGASGLAACSVCGYASFVEPNRLHVRRYQVRIPGLPAELDGLRIVHVSDTHYGPYMSRAFLRETAAQANLLEPDLVALTGDYVHFTPDAIEPGIELLTEFRGRLGAVAVMGNHEHWEGAGACRQVFDHIGIPLLDNARLFLTPEGLQDAPVSGRSLALTGVGDYWEDEVSFDKALGGVPEDVPRVLLSHNPDVAEIVGPGRRVDLMLSGHTHGGQVSLPVIGPPMTTSKFGKKYIGGLCQGPHCPVIVSRGVGLAFLPVRFRVPPELGLITLRRTAPISRA